MDDSVKRQLLIEQNECTVIWNTLDGGSTGTIVNFLWHEERFWLMASGGSARVNALRRDPRITLVLTGVGTSLGVGRCLTVRGRCKLHNDANTRDWFFPKFARSVLRQSEKGAATMAEMLNSPHSWVLEVIGEKEITHDSHDMLKMVNAL